MAVLSPSQRIDDVTGSLREVQAKFASVATGDTFVSGLAVVTGFSISPGAGKVMTGTVGTGANSGTLTITVTAGPDTNTFVAVQGF